MVTRAARRRTNVLVLTLEVELVRLTRSILEPGYKVSGANTATHHDLPDIVIVDTENLDLEALSRSKQNYPRASIIALCQEYREADCIAVLDMDADYLPRPFRAQDLAARVRVAELRRFNATARRRHYRKGPLVFDLLNRKLAIEGRPIALAPAELTVLTFLASRAGTIATYDQLLAELGLVCSERARSALRSCIFRLRRRIECDPIHAEILLTEAGVGYRLAQPVDHDLSQGRTGGFGRDVDDVERARADVAEHHPLHVRAAGAPTPGHAPSDLPRQSLRLRSCERPSETGLTDYSKP